MSILPDRIKSAGVVGAGGAGFPAYVKASSRAELVLMNAAECEPLLHKDIEILSNYTEEVLAGMEQMMAATGAAKGIIGIKRKHEAEIRHLASTLKKRGGSIVLHQLGDFYPAGDEYCLVYELTGRLIPPGGLPLDVGVIVNNVETFYNIAVSSKTPVVSKFITVAGEVKKPVTLQVPIGMPFAEAIALAGGAACKDPVAIDGGPMMGKVVFDFSESVTKTTAGLIVLPKTHPLVIKKAAGRPVFSRIGRSACDQCSMCTMLCPRNLLGYNVEPHKVMRGLLFCKKNAKLHNESALLCCECSLCSLFACPEDLDPRNVCVGAKSDLREIGVAAKTSAVIKRKPAAHPVREYRKVPVSQLIMRLGLSKYKKDAPLSAGTQESRRVRIMLSQHIGAPAVAVVSAGQKVKIGDVVGQATKDKLSVPVHASITGTVATVASGYVEIEA